MSIDEKNDLRMFIGIALLSLLAGIALGAFNGRFALHDFLKDAGLMAYHQTASSLLHYGSFHDPDTLFFETFRRPPGYPLLVAIAYLIAGEHLWSVWILHLFLWVANLFLLWRVSARFFPQRQALLPPLFFGLWWGALAQLFVFNVEISALFWILLFVWSFLRYREIPMLRFAIVQSVAFALLILTKPIFLYAVPFTAIFLVWESATNRRRAIAHAAIIISIIALLVGSWSLYSYRTVGTFQLSSNALTLLRRADDTLLPFERIKAFAVASVAGDYTADIFYPGYADNPEPLNKETLAREKAFFERRLPDKSNDTQLQNEIYEQATSLIKRSPVKFVLSGFVYLLRLNMPLNHKGEEVARLFVGTHRPFSVGQKLAALLTIFSLWFAFVAAVWLSAMRRLRARKAWGILLFFLIYVNSMYAFFTHAEARYLMPVMPFYFLFFTAFLIDFKKRI